MCDVLRICSDRDEHRQRLREAHVDHGGAVLFSSAEEERHVFTLTFHVSRCNPLTRYSSGIVLDSPQKGCEHCKTEAQFHVKLA